MAIDRLWMDAADNAILRLTRTCGLTPSRAAALRILLDPVESYAAGVSISTISAVPGPKLMTGGWASEMRILRDGRRQIFSFVMSGDVVLSRGAEGVALCDLVALTPVTCTDVTQLLARAQVDERDELRQVLERALTLGRDRRYDLLRRLALGSPVARVADCLLDLHDRLAVVDLATNAGFEMPLTAEQIADACELSAAQVRRSLAFLHARGLVILSHDRAIAFDAAGLRAIPQR